MSDATERERLILLAAIVFLYESCAPQFESKRLMTKRQLIDDIRKINLTVQPQFLAQFDDEALKQYLEHLEGAQRKHLRIGGWVRKTPKLRMVS